MAKFTLRDLEKRIASRAKARAEKSYTRTLFDRGVSYSAKKLGEEAIETTIAAVGQSKKRLTEEASDLLYHLLVVLKSRKVSLKAVEATLARRTKQSGHEEKASRGKRKNKRKNKSKPARKPKKSRRKPKNKARKKKRL
ncbi:MAG: phosphoribosyl-ATP diphosphatase [Pseudolabrys sp.]|nr:phosphoribosyl-ATP diphosphatase [Pseudolabrys sp.]